MLDVSFSGLVLRAFGNSLVPSVFMSSLVACVRTSLAARFALAKDHRIQAITC